MPQTDLQARDIRHTPCSDLPELVLVARTEIEKALPKLDTPCHPDCMEIYFAYKGKKSLFAEGREYQLAGGDFILTPPGVPHSTGPLPVSKCAHYWLRVNLKIDRCFLGSACYEPLRQQLLQLGVTHGAASAACHENVRHLYDLAAGRDQPLAAIDYQFTLGTLLLKLLQTVHAHTQKSTGPAVDAAIRFMKLHLEENLSVADFARSAGYSTSAFHALFKKETGIAPKEFFLRLKLDQAKTLLKQPHQSVTQISHALGFSSSQYFSTAFKRYHLLSPGEFRQKHAKKG